VWVGGGGCQQVGRMGQMVEGKGVRVVAVWVCGVKRATLLWLWPQGTVWWLHAVARQSVLNCAAPVKKSTSQAPLHPPRPDTWMPAPSAVHPLPPIAPPLTGCN
jgi:hypothetical protein